MNRNDSFFDKNSLRFNFIIWIPFHNLNWNLILKVQRLFSSFPFVFFEVVLSRPLFLSRGSGVHSNENGPGWRPSRPQARSWHRRRWKWFPRDGKSLPSNRWKTPRKSPRKKSPRWNWRENCPAYNGPLPPAWTRPRRNWLGPPFLLQPDPHGPFTPSLNLPSDPVFVCSVCFPLCTLVRTVLDLVLSYLLLRL